MIIILAEKYFGSIKVKDEDYNIITTNHISQARPGSDIPRDSISKALLTKLFNAAEDELIPDEKQVIIWKKANGFYNAIVFFFDTKKKAITIITTALTNNKNSRIFNSMQNRIVIEHLN